MMHLFCFLPASLLLGRVARLGRANRILVAYNSMQELRSKIGYIIDIPTLPAVDLKLEKAYEKAQTEIWSKI